LAAWDDGQNLGVRFDHACEVAKKLHPHWSLGSSYSGFAEALVRQSRRIIDGIKTKFRRMMLLKYSRRLKRYGWYVFAVDGSRLEAPLTVANEETLGCAGREKSGPQVFMTTLWNMGVGLPWDFRVGPGTDSERRHLEQMLGDLPPGSLIVADAGFVGFETCWRMLNAGHSFLLRVGGNITLLTELGWEIEEKDGLVYLWPTKHRDNEPLVLRLITLERDKQTIYLLTNIRQQRKLSHEEAGILYEMRWGIEVFYRSYKQTLDRKRLLSRTPQTCLAECQWTMLGLWLLGLMTVDQLLSKKIDPLMLSVASARDAIRRAMRRSLQPRRSATGSLRRDLSAAVKDTYHRHGPKAARDYPRKKQQKPPGPPIIKSATEKERQRASRLKAKIPIAA